MPLELEVGLGPHEQVIELEDEVLVLARRRRRLVLVLVVVFVRQERLRDVQHLVVEVRRREDGGVGPERGVQEPLHPPYAVLGRRARRWPRPGRELLPDRADVGPVSRPRALRRPGRGAPERLQFLAAEDLALDHVAVLGQRRSNRRHWRGGSGNEEGRVTSSDVLGCVTMRSGTEPTDQISNGRKSRLSPCNNNNIQQYEG